jgi:predicted phosphodiesterase
MSTAALYDIHGNLPALEAVLNDLRRERVDQIVIGGDVLPGPMPAECLDLLAQLELPTHFIMGNGDRETLARMQHLETDWYRTAPTVARQPTDWTAQQLSPPHAKLIANWPATLSLKVDGLGEVLFCHATPRNDTDIFFRRTPDEPLQPIFAGVRESVVICGHTHMQFDRTIGKTRVINAGSVGMPFGKSGADWLLLGPDVALRHTDYDLQRIASPIRAIHDPVTRDFLQQYILHPPSEDQIMQAYSQAELK